MEAISFGIPIIATNVGGSSEIASKHTGVLIQENPQIEDIKESIIHTLLHKSRDLSFRKEIYTFWLRKFNAKDNYIEFTKDIYDLNN